MMDKLKVLVGLVYTQLMFCDEHGKFQFHRVITDVDRPWLSIKEVLRMVKQVLSLDKPPIDYNFSIQSVHIDIQYRKINFSNILEILHKEMKQYLGSCKVFINTINDCNDTGGEDFRRNMSNLANGIKKFSLLIDMDRNEQPDMIQVFWVQKEQYMPLIYSDYCVPMRRNKQHEPLNRLILSNELFLENVFPNLVADGERPGSKNVSNLRGSPNVRTILIA